MPSPSDCSVPTLRSIDRNCKPPSPFLLPIPPSLTDTSLSPSMRSLRNGKVKYSMKLPQPGLLLLPTPEAD
ncbi:hypothetical protein BaRGS_00012247 [Batillaria attramentaria]|uniref:Uncharacterized protein n=1 Tax=Batillaria attramentaria TaxID=370345 RepID=A0ABD0LB51_9CAEN